MSDLLNSAYYMATMGNIFLLLVLLYIFIQDYRKVKSQFTFGLVLFSSLLLLNAFISCPVTSLLFFGATCCTVGIGPTFLLNSSAAIVEFIGLLIFTYIITK
jgi:hypothetical protein